MKTKTNVAAGAITSNHNQGQATALPVKSVDVAKAAGLCVRTQVKAGTLTPAVPHSLVIK